MNQEQLKLAQELAQKAVALTKLIELELQASKHVTDDVTKAKNNSAQPSSTGPIPNPMGPPSSTGPGFFAKKPPVARTTNKAGDLLVTKPEANRLYRIAMENDWTKEEYGKYLQDAYSVTHGYALPSKFYRQAEANIKLGKPVAYSRLKSGKDQDQTEEYTVITEDIPF